MASQNINRRKFVKLSGAGLAATAATPYFFSTPKTLADESKSKNDRLRLALIGAGGMGMGNMRVARHWGDLVAVADVDSRHAERANREFSDGKADVYTDYRHILERDDIDALHIGTPDHWHAKQLIEAVHAGFDVYCEKPLTHNIEEGELICQAVKDTGRIVQVGTQQRSTFHLFVKAIALVAAGRIGKIKHIQAAIGGGFASPSIPVTEVPRELDWDRWLGPAEMVDYRFARIAKQDGNKENPEYTNYTNGHYDFRWWYDYSAGKLTDWGAHHVDISMWALAAGGQATDPVSMDGSVTHPVPFENGYPTINDQYNTPTKFDINVQLAGDVELRIRSDSENGILLTGDKGRIFVNRGKLTGKPVEDLKDNPLPEDAIQQVYRGMPVEHNERKAHWANFFHCCRERVQPISDVQSHVQALNICHLTAIFARLGRPIQWDSATQQVVGDDAANALLGREYRKGYEIEG